MCVIFSGVCMIRVTGVCVGVCCMYVVCLDNGFYISYIQQSF